MSELKQLQRRMAAAVMTPLTRNNGMKAKTTDGRSMHAEAKQFIKPNDRLSSFDRLEIYNQQYWFRVLDAFADDFPGLRAIIGDRKFDQLSLAYLQDCPSRSYTLRNLGSHLPVWLRAHPEYTHPQEKLALDMVRLEWAHIEAFDAADEPVVGPEDLLEITPATHLGIQPHIRLLQLVYPVEDLLLTVKSDFDQQSDSASNAGSFQRKQHPAVKKVQGLKPERIFLAIHRKQFIVCYRRLSPEAFRMLRSLQQGNPLGISLDHALRGSRLRESELAQQLQEWFTDWSQMGWFCKTQSTIAEEADIESAERTNK